MINATSVHFNICLILEVNDIKMSQAPAHEDSDLYKLRKSSTKNQAGFQ